MFENTPVAELAVGRSTVRRRILALLIADPAVRLHLREIQRRAGTSPGTASRELTKLVSAGLIEREAEGNQVYFRGSTSPFATMLRSLLLTAPTLPPNPARRPRATASLPAPAGGAAEPAGAHSAAESTEVAAGAGGEASTAAATAGAAAAPTAPTAIAPRVIRPETSAPLGAPLAIPGGATWGARADPLGLDAGATVAAQLRSIYRERLRGIYLYGPRASDGAPPDSDVDLLVVLDRIERYGEELERTSAVCASVSLELEVIVSRIFVSEADWRGRTDGQLPVVRAEAVSL